MIVLSILMKFIPYSSDAQL